MKLSKIAAKKRHSWADALDSDSGELPKVPDSNDKDISNCSTRCCSASPSSDEEGEIHKTPKLRADAAVFHPAESWGNDAACDYDRRLRDLTDYVSRLAGYLEALRVGISADTQALKEEIARVTNSTIQEHQAHLSDLLQQKCDQLLLRLKTDFVCTPLAAMSSEKQMDSSPEDSTGTNSHPPGAALSSVKENNNQIQDYDMYGSPLAEFGLLDNAQSVGNEKGMKAEFSATRDYHDVQLEFDELFSTYPYVLIHGLKTQRLNGLSGTIIGPEEGKRLPVRVYATQEKVKIKLENLTKYTCHEGSVDVCFKCSFNINLCSVPSCDCSHGPVSSDVEQEANAAMSSGSSCSSTVQINRRQARI